MRPLIVVIFLFVGFALNVRGADERREVRIYDISDRLPAFQIFPGPDVKLGYIEPPPSHIQMILDKWIQRIHASNPEAWKEEGVAIEFRGGRLVVMHRRAIHKQVAEILGFEDGKALVPKEKK